MEEREERPFESRSAETPEGPDRLPTDVSGGAAGEGASRADAPGDPTSGSEFSHEPSRVVESPDPEPDEAAERAPKQYGPNAPEADYPH